MSSKLYKRDQYLNKMHSFLSCNDIVEYDISQAGYNISKKYGLLTAKQEKKLDSLSKKDKHYQIGWMQRNDQVFKKALKEAFIEIRREFFEANDIEDDDILSIKKDAIFLLKRCQHTQFDNVIFRDKNTYSTFIYMNDCEYYYNPYDKLDVKNINDEVVAKHNDYMNNFIKLMCKHIETSTEHIQLRYIRRFIDKYKRLELPVGYYRQYDKKSYFELLENEDNHTRYDSYWEDRKEDLDISYNYLNIIIPMLNLLL